MSLFLGSELQFLWVFQALLLTPASSWGCKPLKTQILKLTDWCGLFYASKGSVMILAGRLFLSAVFKCFSVDSTLRYLGLRWKASKRQQLPGGCLWPLTLLLWPCRPQTTRASLYMSLSITTDTVNPRFLSLHHWSKLKQNFLRLDCLMLFLPVTSATGVILEK